MAGQLKAHMRTPGGRIDRDLDRLPDARHCCSLSARLGAHTYGKTFGAKRLYAGQARVRRDGLRFLRLSLADTLLHWFVLFILQVLVLPPWKAQMAQMAQTSARP